MRLPTSARFDALSPKGGRDPIDGASLDWGIGGSRNPAQLKCLHAHVAFALARPGYAIGDEIMHEIPELWPSVCCCSEAGDT